MFHEFDLRVSSENLLSRNQRYKASLRPDRHRYTGMEQVLDGRNGYAVGVFDVFGKSDCMAGMMYSGIFRALHERLDVFGAS